MGKKFFILVLVFGILFSIDCKDIMRFEKICPLTKLTQNKKLPPCHQEKATSKKDDCNCAKVEKATFYQSDLTVKPSLIFNIVQLKNFVFHIQFSNFKNTAVFTENNQNPPPIFTKRLQI